MILIPIGEDSAMTLYRTQVELQPVSGVPEDVVVNTWHFQDNDVEAPMLVAHDINGVIASAYTRVDPLVGNSMAEMISSSISRVNPPKVKTYVIDPDTGNALTEPFEDTFAGFPNPLGAGPLPREVAFCLSYHGYLVGQAEEVADGPDAGVARDRPAARHRGRIYLGPLSQAALTAGTESRPGNAVQVIALAMATYLLTPPAPLYDNGCEWVVYSRKNAFAYPVTGAWVDNEWDTQRRRGLRRTVRQVTGTGLG
jgi:hypothetical protein